MEPKNNIQIEKEEHKNSHQQELFDKNYHYSFYLFVNPTSGGNKAAEFTKLESECMTLHLDNPKDKDSKQKYKVDLQFTNLFKEEERDRGFQRLAQEIKQDKTKCRAVVCGGDGTVMWVVEEMVKYKVDIDSCPIGIVAFGTGNDFSRVLGWGASAPGKVIGESLSGLKALIQKWIFSQIVDFDIWDISVKVDDERGHFKVVKKNNGKLEKNPIQEKDGKEKKLLQKHMSNYCSVGVDARIGYGFDKNRKKSQIGNKCVYAWEGFKKFFIKTAKMTDIVDNLEIRHEEDKEKGTGIMNKIEDIKLTVQGKGDKQQVLFKSRPPVEKGKKPVIDDNDNTPYLKGNPACLICSNIPSYGGGAVNMWQKAAKNIGVENINKKKKLETNFKEQNFGDGELEFMGFANGLKLSLEQVIVGNSDRCAQGKGPFYLNFKDKDEKNEPVKTYFQIDGEFYQAVCPKYIKFELAKALPRGKIRVMAENSPKKK